MRLRPSGFCELKEKLCTPVEKSNWLISSLRLLSAMYDWEDRYTGASGEITHSETLVKENMIYMIKSLKLLSETKNHVSCFIYLS